MSPNTSVSVVRCAFASLVIAFLLLVYQASAADAAANLKLGELRVVPIDELSARIMRIPTMTPA